MIFLVVILTLYCFLLLVLQIGWQKAVREREMDDPTSYPMLSVVIPVRNEAEQIPKTLAALKNQSYGNFEVIVVNDHSTDHTVKVVMQNSFAGVSILHNKEEGKKAALQTGIDQAKGEIIVTTDADCVMSELWLESIQKTFSNKKLLFAFGAVGMSGDQTLFARLQRVEFASLIGSGAATSAFGFPTMCNGANLAFRKSAFNAVKGYEGNRHIASGDDEFLMRKFYRLSRDGVKFIPFRWAVVTTMPKQSVSEFISQRIRWAGKWQHNTSSVTVALAIFILLLQPVTLVGYITLFAAFNYAIAMLLVIKAALEGYFIYRVCRFTSSHFSLAAFLLLQFIYPFYVIVIGILSNFARPTWKGRNV